ncbi:MAG: PDZ domain-containing protein [Firmicutes bacterium]|nr:PDZ domain-containing protein [Bacillota bacterium]
MDLPGRFYRYYRYLPLIVVIILGVLLGIGLSHWLPGPQHRAPGTGISLPPGVGPTAPGTGDSNLPTVNIAQAVSPAVVGITGAEEPGLFSRTGGERSGSGVIFDAQNGLVVTNNHVVQGVKSLTVTLADGREVGAELVGRDPRTDLAVLRLSAPNLVAANFGDSDAVSVGETAIAIGNPLGMKFARSVTVGVISGLNRQLATDEGNAFNLIQTDAAINPGNSGGALVNARGQVIGINTIKITIPGFEGMGFAIPINQVKNVIASLVQEQKVVRPALGVRIIGEVTSEGAASQGLPVDYGVAVDPRPGSPADKAGLESGDIIVAIEGIACRTAAELQREVLNHRVGDPVRLKIIRIQGKTRKNQFQEMDVTVQLGQLS